jgi:hypothetical protein
MDGIYFLIYLVALCVFVWALLTHGL